MVSVPPGIFRQYDIRGVYGQDLTDEMAKLIGKAIGTFFQRNGQKTITVGRDNRISGENIFKNLTKGLLETGGDVVDLGIALSPFIYFTWYEHDANATIMITASHNPAQYNGFKCSLNKKPLVGADYQKIKEICSSGDFSKGPGSESKKTIWPDYQEKIKSSIKLSRKLKVGVDCGNGTASLFAPILLQNLGCEVFPLFCDSDGSFPNHQPYPQKTEYYQELIEKIKKEKLDIGLAFDGDGDRLGVFDNLGNSVEGDRLAMIFAESICRQHPGSKIVMNNSTSISVIDFINACGGKFFFSKTGYPYVTAKMNEIGAIFGGEISGHFFFKDVYFGFDDALYAGCRILKILSESPKSFSEIINQLPRYFETREFRVEVPPHKNRAEIVKNIKEEIKTEFPEAGILDIDGVRFSFEDGWGLIRASNTEPLLTGRAEARNAPKLEKIKEIIKEKLNKNEVSLDWEKFK